MLLSSRVIFLSLKSTEKSEKSAFQKSILNHEKGILRVKSSWQMIYKCIDFEENKYQLNRWGFILMGQRRSEILEKDSNIFKHSFLKAIAEFWCFKGCNVFLTFLQSMQRRKNVIKVNAYPVFQMFSYFLFSEKWNWGYVPLTWFSGIYEWV